MPEKKGAILPLTTLMNLQILSSAMAKQKAPDARLVKAEE